MTKQEIELSGSDFYDEIFGRVLCDGVMTAQGEELVPADTMLDKAAVRLLKEHEIDMVRVRSPLTCLTPGGVCQKCFGMDLATRKLAKI